MSASVSSIHRDVFSLVAGMPFPSLAPLESSNPVWRSHQLVHTLMVDRVAVDSAAFEAALDLGGTISDDAPDNVDIEEAIRNVRHPHRL